MKKEADLKKQEIADEIAADVPDGDGEEVPHEETEENEIIRNLRRKDRDEEESTTVNEETPTPTRRRRRRV